MLDSYKNEPLTDFSVSANREAFQAALDQVKSEIGRTYPLVIGGERIELDETFPSVNPARPSEVLGHFANGTARHVDMAVEAATKAFKDWQHTSANERSRYLLRAAAEMPGRALRLDLVLVLGLVVLQTFAEGGDAFGEVAHERGDLAPAAKQQKQKDRHDQKAGPVRRHR